MPIIDVPDGLGPRQDPVLTQTIIRPETTIVATVTLGDGGTPAANPTAGTSATQSAYTSAASGYSPPVTPTGSSALTSDQLGAVLGSIFGVLFVLFLCWCCCRTPRRRSSRRLRNDTDSDASSYTSQVRVRVRADPRFAQVWYPSPQVPERPWPAVIPHPARFPPTRPTPGYRQTRYPQISGVSVYP